LQLESISPEYFQDVRGQRNEQIDFVSDDTHQLSLDQIDDRIKLLKTRLLNKRRKVK